MDISQNVLHPVIDSTISVESISTPATISVEGGSGYTYLRLAEVGPRGGLKSAVAWLTRDDRIALIRALGGIVDE